MSYIITLSFFSGAEHTLQSEIKGVYEDKVTGRMELSSWANEKYHQLVDEYNGDVLLQRVGYRVIMTLPNDDIYCYEMCEFVGAEE